MSHGNVAIVLPGLIYEAPKLKQLMSQAAKRKYLEVRKSTPVKPA